MSDTAQSQEYQKVLSDALQKQMTILGKQIVILKARKVAGLQVTDDGHVTEVTGDPKEVANQLLQEFSGLSSPLVKKTMQPLLDIVIPTEPITNPVHEQPEPEASPVTPPMPTPLTEHHEQPAHEQTEGKEAAQ